MRAPDWYVIQVQAGREAKACEMIQQACQDVAVQADAGKVLEECFSPSYEFRRKIKGEWVVQKKLLLPGYVIAVTGDPWKLARVLNMIGEFTKLLAMGKTFVPLSADDRSWMERWLTEGDHSIPISIAYKEGDSIVVTDGPLVGHEAMITKVNRRKRIAYLEIHAGQMTIHTTVGLEVLPEHP